MIIAERHFGVSFSITEGEVLQDGKIDEEAKAVY